MSHGCMMNTKAYKYTRVYCPICWPCHLDLGIDLDVCSAGAVNEKNNEDHLQPSWKFVVLFIFPLIVILYNECIFCLAGKSLMKKPETRNARCRCTEVARVTDIWADLNLADLRTRWSSRAQTGTKPEWYCHHGSTMELECKEFLWDQCPNSDQC